MRYQGRLSDWNDDKGFGFVVPNGGGERAFVHIKAFAAPAPRPDNGALISYAVHRDEQGRLNASSVQLSGTAGGRQRRRSSGTTPSRPRIAFGLLALVLTGVLWLDDLIPDPLLLALAVLNLISFAAYWRDKNAARAQQWRVQESTLHLLALLGGWPGAAIAQGLFRHKTRKSSFQVVFWLSVLFNLAALSLFAFGLEPAP